MAGMSTPIIQFDGDKIEKIVVRNSDAQHWSFIHKSNNIMKLFF